MRTRQFGAAAAAAAAAALVFATSGCSPDTVGTPTEPAPYGTPVRLTIDSVEVDYTVTWEVTVTGIQEAPFRDTGHEAVTLDEYPNASCWNVTATWTQIDGPPTGTDLPLGSLPQLDAIYPDGSEALNDAQDACDFFAADIARDNEYIYPAISLAAPGDGQTIKTYEPISSISSARPSTIRITPFAREHTNASYVEAVPRD